MKNSVVVTQIHNCHIGENWNHKIASSWFLIYLLHVFFPVDKNGDVCISILHEPGEDKYGYEKPEERWLPIHTVETIMISVISMLADPNGDSPANVDAAVSFHILKDVLFYYYIIMLYYNYYSLSIKCFSEIKELCNTLQRRKCSSNWTTT